jgi:hypothetical protein
MLRWPLQSRSRRDHGTSLVAASVVANANGPPTTMVAATTKAGFTVRIKETVRHLDARVAPPGIVRAGPI